MQWRSSTDPYVLALAEILLQKTKADDAAPTWHRLLSAYPTAEALLAAPETTIYQVVAPLGLGQQRTRRLKGMAQALCDGSSGGRIPGLGPYGAAIVALSQGEDPVHPPVDGNIARVMTRFRGFTFSRGESRKKAEVKSALTELLATQQEAHFKLRLVYSLVDLGATICKPISPDCASCPLARSCALASGRSE